MDELRRAYHDHISDLRSRTGRLLAGAADAVEQATAALVEADRDRGRQLHDDLGSANEPARIENDVLDILARESPVGRDLRVVLASLFIAQAAGLCIGLARTLAARAGQGDDVLTPTLRGLASEIAAETVTLLRLANGAWAVLSEDEVQVVVAGAEISRLLQRRFLAELLLLEGVPVEAAVDLGMLARAYERLTDHAVSIAGRVVFAATGAPPGGSATPTTGEG